MSILNCQQQYKVAFWAITAPIAVYVAVLLALGLLNPLWFREDFLEWIHRHVTDLAKWRSQRLSNLEFKVNLFNHLKKGA